MQFGKYRLIRKLAAGGMAEIFLARQEGMEGFQKNVVIKRILPVHADNDELIQMFLDEARIAAGLTHPNIVQIYELGQEDKDFFIAMEFVHGMDLRHICERGLAVGNFIPLKHACRIVADAAAGLHYAHNKTDASGNPLHIVHRDISPQNILVSFEGTSKITDFGIAKAANKVTTTRTGQVKGKFAYMSPEQCNGLDIDNRSDIFALGTVLYEITVCRRLFKGDTDIQTIQSVSDASVTPPTEVQPSYPRDLEYIVMKALRKDPGDRFQSAREMQMALEDFLTDNRMKTGPLHTAEYLKEIFPDKLEPPGEDPDFVSQYENSNPGVSTGPRQSLPPTGAAAASPTPAPRPTPAAGPPKERTGPRPPPPAPPAGPRPGGPPAGGPPAGGRPGPPGGPRPGGPPGPPGGPRRGGPPRGGPPAGGPPAGGPPGKGGGEDDHVSFVANPDAPYDVGPTAERKKKKRRRVKASSSVKRVEHRLRAEDEGDLEGYEKGSRIYYLILGAVVFLMLAFSAYLIVSEGNFFASDKMLSGMGEDKPDVAADLGEPPPPLPSVPVNVTSEPEGAYVVVNGVLQSGQTPGDFKVIPGSINTVSLYLEGHKPHVQNIEVDAGSTNAEPVAARFENLETLHAEWLKVAEKKQKAEKKKRRRKGEDDEEEEELPQAWPRGKFTIKSVPDAATVILDGKNVGVTPITVENLAADVEHHITLRKSGHLDHVITHEVYPNEDIELPAAELVPEDRELAKHYVDFRLEPSPKGAQVLLNDEIVASGQLFRPNIDRNQALRIEVKNKDYVPWRRVIHTSIGSFYLRPELSRVNKTPGTLTLDIKPTDCLVFIGQNQYGPEEVKEIELPNGKHKLTLVNPRGKRGEVMLEVNANQLSHYSVDFRGNKPRSRRLE